MKKKQQSRTKRAWTWIKQHKWEVLMFVVLLGISGAAHAYNMFGYPYFENDEATYASRAWSVLAKGELAPYTYWYDHTPGGWLVIAVWQFVTMGDRFFDTYLISGRSFMLLVQLVNTVSLYLIARKLGGRYAAVIATLLFSLSPLGIYFHRRILLDNLMTMWMLWSVLPILYRPKYLSSYILSGLAFGMAFLTKINAALLGPVLLYAIYTYAPLTLRWHAIVQWLMSAGVVAGSFFLYPILKGELLPSENKVSFLGTLQFQSSRGTFSYPWQPGSNFWEAARVWMRRDLFVVVAGVAGVMGSFLLSFIRKGERPASHYRLAFLLFFMMLLFYLRGKLVIDFYIVPLIPLMALNLGLVLSLPLKVLKPKFERALYMLLPLLVIGGIYATADHRLYVRDETTNQEKAVAWVQENVPKDSLIIIDNYALLDLQMTHGFTGADYVFKVQYDEETRQKYAGDWRNADYILLTHELLKQIKEGTLPDVKDAFDHAELVADFTEDISSYIDLKTYLSTNGDWAQVYKVKSRDRIILQDGWAQTLNTFLRDYGQIVDPQANDVTTSQAQAHAMVRAAMVGDQNWFSGIWQWTQDHMRYRQSDSLVSSRWALDPETGEYALAESTTESDADADIALALIIAYQQWGDEQYLLEARNIVADIWAQEVIPVGDGYYYAAFSTNGTPLNADYAPAHISPFHFKLFAAIDPDRDWNKLVDDSYDLLIQLQAQSGTGLIPDWTGIAADGSPVSALVGAGAVSPQMTYDSLGLVWRIALDARLTNDVRAHEVLQNLGDFYAQEWRDTGRIDAIYNTNGEAIGKFEDVAPYSQAVVAMYYAGYQTEAKAVYKEKVMGQLNDGSWSKAANNLDNQTWPWLMDALLGPQLQNPYDSPRIKPVDSLTDSLRGAETSVY